MIDGLAVLAAVGPDVDYAAVHELVFTNAERELGVAAGDLHPPPVLDPVRRASDR